MEGQQIPKRINARWLQQAESRMRATMRTLADGSPNPAYTEQATELEEARAEYERRQAFEDWVKQTCGMVLNNYPLRTADGTYPESAVFLKKDRETGKTTYLTVVKAWEKYLAFQAESK